MKSDNVDDEQRVQKLEQQMKENHLRLLELQEQVATLIHEVKKLRWQLREIGGIKAHDENHAPKLPNY